VVGQVELAEQAEVLDSEAAPELGGQRLRERLEHRLAVLGAGLATLLVQDDAAPDLEVGEHNERVHLTLDRAARGLDQRADLGDEGRELGQGVAHRSPPFWASRV
jgi:hypothetical protein